MEQPCGPRQALICCVRSALATPARMGGGGVAHGDGVNSLPVAIRLHPVSGTLLAETRNRSTGISGTLRWTPLIELANLEKNSETVRLRRYFEVGRNMAIIFKQNTLQIVVFEGVRNNRNIPNRCLGGLYWVIRAILKCFELFVTIETFQIVV
jgi:hypothetical protein